MAEEQEPRVSMSFKFEPDIPALLEALAGREYRSMTRYLEILIREKALSAKLIKKNGNRTNSK